MNYNPYAAPQAMPPQQPPPPQGGGQPLPWEIGEVLGAAWTAFKANWAVLVFSFVALFAILMVLGQIPTVLLLTGVIDQGSIGYWAVTIVLQIVEFAITSFFEVGLVRIYLGAARGQEPSFGELFGGGAKMLPLLALRFLSGIAIVIGLIFFIFPGVYIALGLIFAEYYLVDTEQGVFDSLKSSWTSADGQRGNLFLYGLVGLLLAIGGMIACCVGIFVAMPVYTVGLAIIFLRVSGRGAPPMIAQQPYYGGPPPGYGGPPPGYGGPPPGAPPGGYGPPGGGGGYGGPPGGGYGGPPGGGGFPPPGGGGYGGPPPGYGPPR